VWQNKIRNTTAKIYQLSIYNNNFERSYTCKSILHFIFVPCGPHITIVLYLFSDIFDINNIYLLLYLTNVACGRVEWSVKIIDAKAENYSVDIIISYKSTFLFHKKMKQLFLFMYSYCTLYRWKEPKVYSTKKKSNSKIIFLWFCKTIKIRYLKLYIPPSQKKLHAPHHAIGTYISDIPATLLLPIYITLLDVLIQ